MALSISIALTTYNGALFVAEQLESYAKQTFLPSEVVCVDDGSADGTRDIVKEFAAKAPFPVRLITYENYLGYKAKFQIAANECKSDIIFFSDQDDVWLPNKLEACLAMFNNPDVLLTYHNATVTDRALQPIGNMLHQAAPQTLNPSGSIEPWRYGNGFTLVFRRELLNYSKYWPQSADFYYLDEREAHDQWFFFLASSLGTIAYIREPLAFYRQHGKNMYGWKKPGRNKLKNYFLNVMQTGMKGFRTREIGARQRAGILGQMQADLTDPAQRQRATVAADGYRKLETGYRLRQEMYASRNILSKISCLANLTTQGAYRPRHEWGVGRRAIVRDILRGVIIPVREAPPKSAKSSSAQ